MAKLAWDQTGERFYETGVNQVVLYIPNAMGMYENGYAWNGCTAVTESPTGAESNKQYADNQVYLNLYSQEEFGGTIEAFTYPNEFAQCDGTGSPQPGIAVGQQNRRPFGLAYRTLIGNDLEGTDYGYKIHLIYGAMASPSEKSRTTVNESPEAMTFSWELTTTPVDVPGTNPLTNKPYKPTSTITIDSTQVDGASLTALEDMLYGTVGTDPYLPMPGDVLALFEGTVVEVTPTEPTYDSGTDTITIPSITGVEYYINNEMVTGSVIISEDTVVTAKPATGYRFPAVVDDDWLITFA